MWPVLSEVQRSRLSPTLVVVSDGRTMDPEITRLLWTYRGRFHAVLLGQAVAEDSVSTIPGVTLQTDKDGTKAASFGAMPGEMMLFNRDGRLLFRGFRRTSSLDRLLDVSR